LLSLVAPGLMNKQIAAEVGDCRDYREDTPRAHHEENGYQVAGRFGENQRNPRNSSYEVVAQYKPMYDFRSRLAALSNVQWRWHRAAVNDRPVCRPQVISIIDDDASVRAASDNLLTSLGYAVYTFVSAEEFLRSTHLNDTSCVIADVQMPGMSGVDLQARLLTQGYRVPFIFMTAFPEETIRARALKAGAICFLTKPFDRLTLIGCLDAALERHGGGTGE
jgi:CheY-like chemotaxis protein